MPDTRHTVPSLSLKVGIFNLEEVLESDFVPLLLGTVTAPVGLAQVASCHSPMERFPGPVGHMTLSSYSLIWDSDLSTSLEFFSQFQ